jgi:aminopeptidase N
MKNLTLLLLSVFVLSCGTTKTPTGQSTSSRKNPPPVLQLYRAAYTMENDLVHTKLDVRPDWSKMQLEGRATITLHPHFLPYGQPRPECPGNGHT